MPIKIPATLPAHDVLRREGVMVMSEETALRQDIRPLQIALLNLMPKKVQTETQFARVIGATPLQIELTLIRITEILTDGAKPTKAARPKPEKKPKPEAAASGEAEGESKPKAKAAKKPAARAKKPAAKPKAAAKGKKK